jgi:1,5-anhydro-D-fructose reductase (1,5-anhydro-D-mannitol-forming)
MLKVGIIGAYGKMGGLRRHLFEQVPDCHVVALCDTRQANGNDTYFSTNPYDIINHPDVEAVAICTPNYLIKDLVVASLNQGKHVLCEKPPGISLADVQAMRQALDVRPGLKLKFGFNHRYHDAILEAKRRIDSGKLGRILWLRGRYGKSVDPHFAKTWRADKRLAGGGILLDQGIHMLDLFLYFCANFDEVKAFTSNQYWNFDVEDNVFAIFRNRQGQTASLHSTMTQWRHLFSLEIFLERGYMVVNGILSSSGTYTNAYAKEELTVALNRSPAPQAKHTHEERLMFDQDYSFAREMDEFVGAIRNNTPIRVGSIDDAEKLMALVGLIYDNDQSASTGASVQAASVGKISATVPQTDAPEPCPGRRASASPAHRPASSRFGQRMSRLDGLLSGTQVTNAAAHHLDVDQAFARILQWMQTAHEIGATTFLVGNGASASMASHMAADLCKNGHLKTQVFTDLSLMTAVANDIGAHEIFSTPLQRLAQPDDLLIAISSSGSSQNILNAVTLALERGMKVITFSAMNPDNPLRSSGHLNFFVRAHTYGEAETCHAALLHYWVDLVVGDIPKPPADGTAAKFVFRTDRVSLVPSGQ